MTKRKVIIGLVIFFIAIATGAIYLCGQGGKTGGKSSPISETADELVTYDGLSSSDTCTPAEAGTSVETKTDTQSSDHVSGISKNMEIGAQLVEDSLTATFGGYDLYDIVDTLGEPESKKCFDSFERWYFSQGLEIDVTTMNDCPVLTNYICFGDKCDLKTDREIGIGSTYDEVVNAYEKELNPDKTGGYFVTVGEREHGIVFIMKDNKVLSYYMTIFGFTQEYFGDFTPDRNYADIGAQEAESCMTDVFGGSEPDDVVTALGEAEKKEEGSDFVRWYFPQGVEIDVSENGQPELENYVYLSGSCGLKTDRGIGIGSTYDEVTAAYKNIVNTGKTNDDRIIIGTGTAGISYIMEEGKVASIYISDFPLTPQYSSDFTPDRP